MADPAVKRPKIITSHSCIPYDEMAWTAYRDGEEELGGYGYGATEDEAINDLLSMEDDDETP